LVWRYNTNTAIGVSTPKTTVALACWIWKAEVELEVFLNKPVPFTVAAEAVKPPVAVILDVTAPVED